VTRVRASIPPRYITTHPCQLSLLPSVDEKWVPAEVRWCSAGSAPVSSFAGSGREPLGIIRCFYASWNPYGLWGKISEHSIERIRPPRPILAPGR